MRWDWFIVFASGAIVTLFFAALFAYESQVVPSEDKISDKELIERTMELEEVKAILEIHNNPQIYVDRSEDFGVEYHISTTQFADSPYDPNNDCLSMKVRLGYDGYPDYILDSSGRYRDELGDQNHIDFLKRGGGCYFAMVEAIPDSVVLNKTREFEEVKAFLEKYPSARIYLSKQGGIYVGYEAKRSDLTGEMWNSTGIPEPSAVLNVEMDKDLNITLIRLSCIYEDRSQSVGFGFDIYENIVEYLDKEVDCWNDNSGKQ